MAKSRSFRKKKRLKWEKKLAKSKYQKNIKNQFSDKALRRDTETNLFLKNIIKSKRSEATRKSSQNSLEFFSTKTDKFLGGSADLTGSNLTKTKYSNVSKKQTNYIHYGIREHLMAAAMNGVAVHKGFIPYGGTFLVFSDYCKNSIRLSAMMKKQVIYVFTHDSIGLGEDGPTHQPIEHLIALRSIPNLLVMRPCDAIETFESWEIAINTFNSPSAIILSRQNLPLIRKSIKKNKVCYGGYFLHSDNNSKLTIIATGSEVSLGFEILKNLKETYKLNLNLVSMPSIELLKKQPENYKKRKYLGTDQK